MPRTQIVVRLGISRNAVASTPPPRSESGAQHRERNVPAAVETSVDMVLKPILQGPRRHHRADDCRHGRLVGNEAEHLPDHNRHNEC
jgi:hypothetical protein